MSFEPIETQYRGHRFRSRLEARWAVFFDELRVAYRYEQQGYRLSAGLYLPDFYLPEWEAHVEIKPSINDVRDEDYRRAMGLMGALVEDSGKAGIVLFGRPWQGEYLVLALATAASAWQTFGGFGECRECDGIGFLLDADDDFDWLCLGPHSCAKRLPPRHATRSPRVQAALQAACFARFEHGETPR